jgi:hypothetical protein
MTVASLPSDQVTFVGLCEILQVDRPSKLDKRPNPGSYEPTLSLMLSGARLDGVALRRKICQKAKPGIAHVAEQAGSAKLISWWQSKGAFLIREAAPPSRDAQPHAKLGGYGFVSRCGLRGTDAVLEN